jgi:hypothetical protein
MNVKYTYVLIFFILFSCKNLDERNDESIQRNDSSINIEENNKNHLSQEKDLDSCQCDPIIRINDYLNNIDFPFSKMDEFHAMFLRKNSRKFLEFKECDNSLFALKNEYNKGLEDAAYISDYGFVNGFRLVLIFIKYPNQYFGRLVTFSDNKLIDKLDAVLLGFDEPPCDIEYNGDSIFYDNFIEKFNIKGLDSIEINSAKLFLIRDLKEKTDSLTVGEFQEKIFRIDSSGMFRKQSFKSGKKEFMKRIWDCY